MEHCYQLSASVRIFAIFVTRQVSKTGDKLVNSRKVVPAGKFHLYFSSECTLVSVRAVKSRDDYMCKTPYSLLGTSKPEGDG